MHRIKSAKIPARKTQGLMKLHLLAEEPLAIDSSGGETAIFLQGCGLGEATVHQEVALQSGTDRQHRVDSVDCFCLFF